MKVSQQCGTAARKAYKILGLINRTFKCKKIAIIINLYIRRLCDRIWIIVCLQAWQPLSKDIDVLERVQRRATRMIDECKVCSYEQRLQIVGLRTLETIEEGMLT